MEALQHFAAALSYIREAFTQQQQQEQEVEEEKQEQQLLLLLRSDFVARQAVACLYRRPHSPEEMPQLEALKETVAAADKALRRDIEYAMQQQQQQRI